MTSTSKGTTSPRPNIRDRSEASSGNPSPKERQRTDVTGDNETKAGDDDTALVRDVNGALIADGQVTHAREGSAFKVGKVPVQY